MSGIFRRSQVLVTDNFKAVVIKADNYEPIINRVLEDFANHYGMANWFDIIGEPTIAETVLDRSVHTSHRIELKGESLRKKQ